MGYGQSISDGVKELNERQFLKEVALDSFRSRLTGLLFAGNFVGKFRANLCAGH